VASITWFLAEKLAFPISGLAIRAQGINGKAQAHDVNGAGCNS
jgi:hypothetical protein